MKQLLLPQVYLCLALGIFWSPSVHAKTCNKRCKQSKKNHQKAKNDCKRYELKNNGPCVVKKNRYCGSGWVTLSAHKWGGTNYRACVRKDLAKKQNKAKAKEACRLFKHHTKRSCKVKRGNSCGSGWQKLSRGTVFGKGASKYRACRKKQPGDNTKSFNKLFQRFLDSLRALVGK